MEQEFYLESVYFKVKTALVADTKRKHPEAKKNYVALGFSRKTAQGVKTPNNLITKSDADFLSAYRPYCHF